VLVVVVVLALGAFAATARGAGGSLTFAPGEFQPEPGAGDDGGDFNAAAAPYLDASHRSDFGGGGGGGGGGGNGGVSGPGFAGLTLMDQRLADNGNQSTVTPPDQGLCTNGFQVLEAVNTVFKVYSPNGGSQSGVEAYVPFFYPGEHQVNRTTTPPTFGPFVSDPKCYFDTGTLRWFMTLLEIDRDPATGALGTQSHLLIAVSKTPVATTNPNAWLKYSVETTDNGPTSEDPSMPQHNGCPCFGDQPLIGADAYGFFVTTNEFPIAPVPGFNGSQIYAFGKRSLESGRLAMERIDEGNPYETIGGIPYSMQPATSPTPLDWDYANNGTEYLEQAFDFFNAGDTAIGLWAITNTKSLDSATPAAVIGAPSVVTTEPYGPPPPAQQAPGPYPLGQFLGDPEEQVNTNDDRMNQVVFAGGLLYSGLNTGVSSSPTPTASTVHSAVTWWIVKPRTPTPLTTSGHVVNQGYVALRDGDTYFPSIGVNHQGEGVITFSYSSADRFYPSAGYATLDAVHGLGPLHTLAAGRKPLDSFDGYPQVSSPPGNGIARWGDYSAAVADAFGNIWFATEWIPGTFGFIPPSTVPPSFLSNWGTAVGEVNP
jgi:hypothetical protein